MPIRIPETHKKTVVRIARLESDQVVDLNRAIRAAAPTSSPRALADCVVSSLSSSIPDLQAVILVLLSLAKTRRHRGVSVAELASDIQAAASEGKADLDALSAIELASLGERIVLLLSDNKTIDVTIRISDVYLAHERLVHSSKILSDIRPVFAADDSASPVVGMIVHNLELSVTDENQRKRLYFAMNIHDLRQLRSVIDRALIKDQALRAVIATGGMDYAEDESGEHEGGQK